MAEKNVEGDEGNGQLQGDEGNGQLQGDEGNGQLQGDENDQGDVQVVGKTPHAVLQNCYFFLLEPVH